MDTVVNISEHNFWFCHFWIIEIKKGFWVAPLNNSSKLYQQEQGSGIEEIMWWADMLQMMTFPNHFYTHNQQFVWGFYQDMLEQTCFQSVQTCLFLLKEQYDVPTSVYLLSYHLPSSSYSSFCNKDPIIECRTVQKQQMALSLQNCHNFLYFKSNFQSL